jgi:pimeloyl-ACP methyl ester carboxylesterase
LAVVILVAGCARVVGGAAELPHPALGAPIQWGPCKIQPLPPEDMPPRAECGELAVPIDYNNPKNGVVTIALIRIPATGEKIGSLVSNPGGPGVSSVLDVASSVEDYPVAIRERFDLVGFDPRGIGFSRPAVRCLTDQEIDEYRADTVVDYNPDQIPGVDYSPAGVTRNEEALKRVVQHCVERVGEEFLANVGTSNVVKDLDTIRAALGDDRLTFIGWSYGTFVGGLYAEAYPDKVRAMVLDGVVDPSDGAIDTAVRQAGAFQQAFNDYAADCALSTDCPLGADPAKAVEVFHSLVDPLVTEPASTSDPRGLSYKDAVLGTYSALYSAADWELLTSGLTALKNGAPPDDLLTLADVYMERDENGAYTNVSDAYTAISCADRKYPTDAESWEQADKRLREVAPFLTYGQFTGHAPKGICAFWPVPPTSEPHRLSAPGAAPILVVSTTHDPATPYQDGVDVAEQLGGTVLTVEGTEHAVLYTEDSPCVDDIATRYLIDLVLPAPDARCVASR